MAEDENKDVLLLKAVDESDIEAVTQLIKYIDDLDLEMVHYAHDAAKEEGNRVIIRLVGRILRLKEMKENKEIDKDAMLIKAVSESDIDIVTQLVKCIDLLNPDTVSVAQDIAKDVGQPAIIRLVGLACRKIEEKKEPSKLGGESMEPVHTNNREEILNYITKQNKLGQMNGLELRNFKLRIEHDDSENLVRRISVGIRNTAHPTKTLLLVGATGSGKTSLINSLVNIAYGTKYEDMYRIKLNEEESDGKKADVSQTEKITVYEFNHIPGMDIEYNLSIIDTPGLNDTRGLEYDKKMFDQLEKLLVETKFGVKEINTIGLVTMASATRLTEAQKYVYEGCMRIFGKDVTKIINIMATYCDSSEPQIKYGLKTAGVEYQNIHKFNNSSLFLSNDSGKPTEIFWNIQSESCVNFLTYLKTAPGISPLQTKQTLETRRQLREGLQDIEKIRKPKIEEFKDMALNCLECKATCHKPCYNINNFFWNGNCKNCEKLQKEDICGVCSCPWESHKRENKQFNNDNIKPYTQKIENVKTLNKVALRPNTDSTFKYVDDLIKKREEKGEDSSPEDLASLKVMKEEEEKMLMFIDPKFVKEMDRTKHLNDNIQTGEQGEACSIM